MGKNRFEDNNEDFDFNNDESHDDYISDPSEMIVTGSNFGQFGANDFIEINTIVLQQALDLVKSSFFWRFKSLKARLKALTDTYYVLMDLVGEE